MRRILVVFVIVLSMISCVACRNGKKEKDMIKYESGIFYNKNWNESIGTYSGKAVIPDEETALKIANAIFDGMEKSKEVQKYVPQSVFYDDQDEVWIVSFWKSSNQITLGGDCNIALQKKDGRVLRIWFGE
ncbi:MAG: hypothetical protein IKV74_01995 [Clostridia bacterium]|nr:hypothetical protein [Clostridia bacterium]